MKNLIDHYVEDHHLAWATTTLASERSRLYGISELLQKREDPQWIFDNTRDRLKPYALKTLFIRLCHFYTWLIEEGHRTGPNQFNKWRRKNAKAFKGAYQRERIDLSFTEAKKRISQIQDKEARDDAYNLLFSGLRMAETNSITGNKIIGKGQKERTFFGRKTQFKTHRKKLSRELGKVGLKPHTLRKLFASRLAQKGARPEDLCEIMGWSSINTAYWYLQPKKESELRKMVRSI